MFCQACGRQIADEARFCNFCGERIASPGTPGGLLSPPTSEDGKRRASDVPQHTVAQTPKKKIASQPAAAPAEPPRAKDPAAPAAAEHPAPSTGGAEGGPSVRPIPTQAVGTPKKTPKGKEQRTMMMGSKVAAEVQAAVERARAGGETGSNEAAAHQAEREPPSEGKKKKKIAPTRRQLPGTSEAPQAYNAPASAVPSDADRQAAAAAWPSAPGRNGAAPAEGNASGGGASDRSASGGSASNQNAWAVAAESEPPAAHAVGESSVSLDAIGVQSAGGRWLWVLGLLLGLCVLSGAGWLGVQFLRGSTAEVEPPAGQDDSSDTTAAAEDEPPSASTGTNEDDPSSAPNEQATTMRPSRPASNGRAPSMPPPTTTQPTVTRPTMTSPTMVAPTMTQPTMTQPTMTEPTMTQPSAEPTMVAPDSPDTPTEVPEERDMEMQLYLSRVRYAVSRYYAARARSCFEHASRNAPSVRGRVVISVTIAAGGQVSRSSVRSNSTDNAALGMCIANRAASWRLPPPPGDEPITLELPFSG